MGALSALEETLENRFDALWARVRDKGPVEVVDALRRECDDKAVVCREGRVMVPNAYDVELVDDIHDRLACHSTYVCQALTDALVRHAERKGYEFAGPLAVHVARCPEVPNGRYHVASRVMEHVSVDGFFHATH
ncbi:FhaA domain-containing protein [Streptomyces sp. NPDC008137]|uniref:DUF3662 domain-containing protein n=1 Tax=Streptomyces sp. NPDC008137 TaxID=3364813 RepID=UPI0036EFF2FD